MIICGDCIEEMKKLEAGSIDLIITSPPYNLSEKAGNKAGGKWKNSKLLNGGYDTYKDNMPYEDYVQWQRNCLSEMMRLIPDNGAIFYNHKFKIHNGIMINHQDILDGFPVRQMIIWKRAGGFNFSPTFFLPTYEVIYMIAKPEFRLREKANAYTDIWEITQEKNNSHPAPFPVAIPERIIASTYAKIVLDPFSGSGSTAVAAKKRGIKYIGIELSETYCKLAEERLAAIKDMSFLM